jgi:hypothetical protein
MTAGNRLAIILVQEPQMPGWPSPATILADLIFMARGSHAQLVHFHNVETLI